MLRTARSPDVRGRRGGRLCHARRVDVDSTAGSTFSGKRLQTNSPAAGLDARIPSLTLLMCRWCCSRSPVHRRDGETHSSGVELALPPEQGGAHPMRSADGAEAWAVGFVSSAAFLAVLLATRWGVGVSPDSVAYVDCARSLLAGDGLVTRALSGTREPFIWHAPFYPIVLAGLGAFGWDVWAVARILNAALFGSLTATVGYGLNPRFAGRGGVRLIGCFLVATSVPLVQTSEMAWSEPLFLLLVVWGLLLLDRHMRLGGWLSLAASAAAVGIASITRYAGIAFVGGGVAALALMRTTSWRRRVSEMALFTGVGLLPFGIWTGRNAVVMGSAVGRKVVLGGIGLDHLGQAASTLLWWFMPARLSDALGSCAWLALLGCGTVAVAGLAILRRTAVGGLSLERVSSLARVMALCSLSYLGVVLFSVAAVDRSTPLDNRILVPVYLLLLVALVDLTLHVRGTAHPGFRRAFLVAGVATCVYFLARGALWIRGSYDEGRGYSSRAWRASHTIGLIDALPAATRIYSNGPDAVYALTSRISRSVPLKFDPASGGPNLEYADELENAGADICEHRVATVVYFERLAWRAYVPPPEELEETLPIVLDARTGDGWLFAPCCGTEDGISPPAHSGGPLWR